MITDNDIIVSSVSMHYRKSQKHPGNFCTYNLDLMKAYDRSNMGFAEQWIKWIMECVKTIR
jgi:hypothetical protein